MCMPVCVGPCVCVWGGGVQLASEFDLRVYCLVTSVEPLRWVHWGRSLVNVDVDGRVWDGGQGSIRMCLFFRALVQGSRPVDGLTAWSINQLMLHL
jgi:hypothetical protein